MYILPHEKKSLLRSHFLGNGLPPFIPSVGKPTQQNLWGPQQMPFHVTCYRVWPLRPPLPLFLQIRYGNVTAPLSMFQSGSDLLSYQYLTPSTPLLPLIRQESQAAKYTFFPFLTWWLASSERRLHSFHDHWARPHARCCKTKDE